MALQNVNNNDPHAGRQSLGWLKTPLLEFTTAATATLFVYGHAYFIGYYHSLGVDLTSLDLPFYNYLAAGFEALMNGSFVPSFWSSIPAIIRYPALGLLAVLAFLIGTRADRVVNSIEWRVFTQGIRDDRRRMSGSVLLWFFDNLWAATLWLLLTTLWLGLLLHSYNFGIREAKSLLTHPQLRVRLFFKETDNRLFPEALLKANCSGNLVPVIQTKDLIFAFSRLNPTLLFVVSRSNLESIMIVPINAPFTPVAQAPDNTCS